MVGIHGVGAGWGVSAARSEIQEQDVETVLLVVESQRARLLETQLAQQIEHIKARNERISKLNDLLVTLNDISKYFKGTDGSHKMRDQKGWKDAAKTNPKLAETVKAELQKAFDEAGISPKDLAGTQGLIKFSKCSEKKRSWFLAPLRETWGEVGGIKFGQLSYAIEKVRGMIDGLNNSQQTETLRLQSLSNKRNEAYDVMSNFIKKMQDNRSSIVGNMR